MSQIELVILELLEKRREGASICPSEAARRMAENAGHPERWRAWMNRVRATASGMAKRGLIAVTQGGEVVDAETARGAIRLRLP